MPGRFGTHPPQTPTKTKTVQFHAQTIEVTEADRKHATKLYQIAKEGMRSGLYVPESRFILVLAEVLLVLVAVRGGVWG